MMGNFYGEAFSYFSNYSLYTYDTSLYLPLGAALGFTVFPLASSVTYFLFQTFRGADISDLRVEKEIIHASDLTSVTKLGRRYWKIILLMVLFEHLHYVFTSFSVEYIMEELSESSDVTVYHMFLFYSLCCMLVMVNGLLIHAFGRRSLFMIFAGICCTLAYFRFAFVHAGRKNKDIQLFFTLMLLA